MHLSLSAREVWGVDRDGGVLWRSVKTNGPWMPLSGSPELFHLAVTHDGREVWGMDKYRSIHVYLARSNQWKNVGGNFDYLAISADGLHIWALSDGVIYHRHGIDDEWTRIRGSLVQIADPQSVGRQIENRLPEILSTPDFRFGESLKSVV